MFFMHIHISRTRNDYHLISLIKTSNAHKEACRKLLLILLRSGRARNGNSIKTNDGGQLVVVFAITKIILFNNKPFSNLVQPLSYLYMW